MQFLKDLGIKEKNFGSSTGLKWNETTDQGELKVYSPVDGKFIASVYQSSEADYENVIKQGEKAFPKTGRNCSPNRAQSSQI